MDVRGRNELAESMLGRALAAMSRPAGVRAESDTEVVTRLAARRAFEDIILEILVMVLCDHLGDRGKGEVPISK